MTKRSSSEPLGGFFDSLAANAAILDEKGRIIFVNRSWCRFGLENGLLDPSFGVGTDYIALCEQVTGSDAETAHQAAEDLRRILRGEQSDLHLTYPCHSPAEQRWFRMHALAFRAGPRRRVAILHENCTEAMHHRLAAERERSQLEQRIAALSAELETVRSRLHAASQRGDNGSVTSPALPVQAPCGGSAEALRGLHCLPESGQCFIESVADACPDLLYVVDIQNRSNVYVSRQAVEFLGYTPEELSAMGSDLPATLFEAEEIARYEQWFKRLARAADGEVIETEFRIRRADGMLRDFRNRTVVYQRDPAGAVRLVVGVARDITARKRSERALQRSRMALRESTRKLRALTARMLTVAEEERRRIARDLHDDMNQRLAMLAVDLGMQARELPETAALLKGYLRRAQGRVAELSEDLRRMAHNLHPSMLDDLGLAIALRSYCEEFSRVENIPVQLEIDEIPNSIPPAISLCLFRIAQECLANIARHAKTDSARVRLLTKGGHIQLLVEDQGVGFHPETRPSSGGLGFVSMRERVRLLGGALSIHSAPGEGTSVRVLIRLPESAEPQAAEKREE